MSLVRTIAGCMLLASATSALTSTGCATMVGAMRDQRALRAAATLNGAVHVVRWSGKPTVVALLEIPARPGAPLRLLDYVQIFGPVGLYRFIVEQGRYRVIAFEDLDDDLAPGEGERTTSYKHFADIVVENGGPIEGLDLVIDRPQTVQKVAALPVDALRRSLFWGEVRPLASERFGAEAARTGVWEPLRFMRERGAGVFFLEPYDPKKTPVLFVHGMGGYPQEFAPLIASLDKTRMQAWVAHYPSGWALGDVGDFFNRGLNEMHTRLRFERLCLVAHSMGGLVTREMLNQHVHNRPRGAASFVRSFISIASPLGGHPSAKDGVRFSPVIIDSWRDLMPEGPFIRRLYREKLPAETRYTLIFGLHGGKPTDGVVALENQLREEALSEASVQRGFHQTHEGLLSSSAVAELVRGELERCVGH